jgi:hypothetical protein
MNTLPKKAIVNQINFFDLVAVLHLFYEGQLDYVHYNLLSRLYLPLHQLDPTNSLFGSVTSLDITAALSSLDHTITNPLEYHFTRRESLLPNIESQYVRSELACSLDDFIILKAKYAIIRISEILHTEIL